MVITITEALEGNDSCMMREENRLASFDGWPIKEGYCIPANMAKAGFYYCSPKKGDDCVRCFCCYRELDNWELEDDPWKEHQKRNCIFAKLETEQSKLTLNQMLQVLEERSVNRLLKIKESFLEAQLASMEKLGLRVNI